MGWTALAGLLALVVASSVSAKTTSHPDNAAATSTYLRAYRKLLDVTSARLPAARKAVNSYVGQVTAECPNVAAQAPQGRGLDGFTLESLYAAGIAFERPYETATIAFARDVRRLRWSSPKLTGLVRLYARVKQTEATSATPHICSELREWVASNYGELPQSTTSVLKTATALISPEEEILTLLHPYARSGTKTLLRSVKRLETRTELRVLKVALPEVVRLQEGLGLRRPNVS